MPTQTPVPVLIKVAYYPRWKAWQGSQALPIYRVAPGLMLVYSQGHTVLRYRRSGADYIGIVFSLLGMGLLGIAVAMTGRSTPV